MSTFTCGKCGTDYIDSPIGYITGCEHYPSDIQPLGAEFEKVLYDNIWDLYITDRLCLEINASLSDASFDEGC